MLWGHENLQPTPGEICLSLDAAGSIKRFSAAGKRGSWAMRPLRPAPGRRTRPGGGIVPCSISRIPLAMALRERPQAWRTCETPP